MLKSFDDDHPLREINIVVYSPEGNAEMTNYLFSVGNSSELYDLKDDREKALYQASKSYDIELIRQLLIILVADNPKEIDLEYLKELVIPLLELYEKLKPNLSNDMENYFKKKLRFYCFLCDSQVNEKAISDLIELFGVQTKVDHQVITFLNY